MSDWDKVFWREQWSIQALWEYALICLYSPRSRFEFSLAGARRIAAAYPTPDRLKDATVPTLQGLLRDQRFPRVFAERTLALAAWIRERDALQVRLPRDTWAEAPGFGLKVASMFVAYTQPHPPGATPIAIDVHVLRWLQAQGVSVPSSLKVRDSLYRNLEVEFRDLAFSQETDPLWLHYNVWLQGVRSVRKAA